MFKILSLLFIFLSFINISYAGTCTNTSRTNYVTNQVLTSTALNADFNQLVTKLNSLDGGCVTDGTLEAASLNATDFAAVTNGITQGCGLVYVDSNTVGVGKCIISVNGNFVKTTTQTNVTWGCSSCSSEVVSTLYYVYAKNGSTGSTLNLLISTVAPGADGYDVSGNKVIGRFYNNSSSNIDTALSQWINNDFSVIKKSFSFSYGTTDATTICSANPCSYINETDAASSNVLSITRGLQGAYTVNLAKTYAKIKCSGNASRAASAAFFVPVTAASSSTISINTTAVDGTTAADTYGTVLCEGY